MGTTDTEKNAPKPNGGLYSRVNVSVKTINIVIAVGLAALIVVLAFVVTHNGFTITFDTDGGSRVASVRSESTERRLPSRRRRSGRARPSRAGTATPRARCAGISIRIHRQAI